MQLPVRFGKYELEQFLGGGMSQVFRATDTDIGRTVAVKILTQEGCRDEEAKKRFLVEARMCGNITHDNIIRIYTYGEHEGRPYIVMEYLTGQDLRHAIDKKETGDLRGKLHIALQAARALAYVHTLSIIHRDIKPDNLHVDTTGRVRLMDFGIAKSANLSLTKTGFALGTPYYMAPEQVLGKPVTSAVDIYAFGIVLYELITGLKPVTGETVESLFYLILHQQLDLEPLHKANTPQELIQLIQRCTSKKAEERPQSFQVVINEMENMIRRIEGGGPPPPLPPSQPVVTNLPPAPPSKRPEADAGTKKPNMAPIYVGAAAIAALAISLAIIFWPGKTAPEPEKKTEVVEKKQVDLPKKNEPPPPVLRGKYGEEMILIPAGKFKSGPGNEDKELPAFYIDKTEMSVSTYNKHCADRGCTPRTDQQELPLVNVTFEQADTLCREMGKRLPSGNEWEKAARGTDGSSFPWGMTKDPDKANTSDGKIHPHALQPVDSLGGGASAYGVLNLIGNASEWVRELGEPSEAMRDFTARGLKKAGMQPIDPNEPWFRVRGGSYQEPARPAHEFTPLLARISAPVVGFRCAADVKP